MTNLTAAQLDALRHVQWGTEHFGALVTGRATPERSQICGAWQQLFDAARRVERMQRTVPTGHVLVDKEAFGELVNAITVLEELR